MFKKILLLLPLCLVVVLKSYACDLLTIEATCIKDSISETGFRQYIQISYGNACHQEGFIWIQIGATLYGPLTASTAPPTDPPPYYFDVTSLGLSPYMCYDIYLNTSLTPTDPHDGVHVNICPCDTAPCSASFKYCVSSSDPLTYTFSSIPNDPWITSYELDYGDGSPTYIGTLPVTHTYAGPSVSVGAHLIAYYYNNTLSCDRWINICTYGNGTGTNGEQHRPQHSAGYTLTDPQQDIDNVKIFPNPASTGSTLSFYLGSVCNVQVQVLDAFGRVVKNIQQEKLAAGEHKIQIETSNLPAGIYMVKMQTPKSTTTNRLTVIK